MTASLLANHPKTFGPESNGALMSPEEFDDADFEDGWRYELINGVLIVSPIPLLNEVDPNEELGHWLREYRDRHPQGSTLNGTFPERNIKTGDNRRRADRVIFAGLGRKPRRGDLPTIIVEFASKRKRDRKRDYETKRDEYMGIGTREYWVFDRLTHALTVFVKVRGKIRTRVFEADQIYRTDLLSGFEVPLKRLFALADAWGDDQPE